MRPKSFGTSEKLDSVNRSLCSLGIIFHSQAPLVQPHSEIWKQVTAENIFGFQFRACNSVFKDTIKYPLISRYSFSSQSSFGAFLRKFQFPGTASERLVGWRPMETRTLTSSVSIQPTNPSFQDQSDTSTKRKGVFI